MKSVPTQRRNSADPRHIVHTSVFVIKQVLLAGRCTVDSFRCPLRPPGSDLNTWPRQELHCRIRVSLSKAIMARRV